MGAVDLEDVFFNDTGRSDDDDDDDLSRTHNIDEIKQEINKIVNKKTRVAEKPNEVIHIMDTFSSNVSVGNTMTGAELLAASSSENVRSPVDTTLMILFTPTSSFSSAVGPTSRLCLRTRRSSRRELPCK